MEGIAYTVTIRKVSAMPTVNIYSYSEPSEALKGIIDDLKTLLAKELTSSELPLSPGEISVRCLQVSGQMIGAVEIEIHAHAFPDRVARQDAICNTVRSFVLERLPNIGDVRVWLILSELGHSW